MPKKVDARGNESTGNGYPNVAKAGGLQSQDAEGEAVVVYCEPLATKDLESSGFPARVNNVAKSALSLEFTVGDIHEMVHDFL